MRLKILAIVVLGAVGIGAAFVAMGGLPSTAATTTEYLTGAVTTGDVTDDVAATGTVATTASYGLSFGAPAHLAGATTSGGSGPWTVTDLKVTVGDTVKKGDVLATADPADLKRELAEATTNLTTAKIRLAIAKTDRSAATATAAIGRPGSACMTEAR
jgi:macrolide-specific efflux system membrane fusion protein